MVVISTPPNTHFEFTKKALESGKHVITEKPFVPTSEEARQLDEIAKANGKFIAVYQNRRWDSDFLTVKHLLKEGTLGTIMEVDTHFDRLKLGPSRAAWKEELVHSSGGGPVYDLGTHLIDQIYNLFGMPKSVYGKVYAQGSFEANLEKPNTVSARLYYVDGNVVNVRISPRSVETSQPRFWIRGTEGSFRKVGLDLQEDQLKGGMKPTAAEFGKDDPSVMKLTVLKGDKIKEIPAPDLKPQTYSKFYELFGQAAETGDAKYIPVPAHEAKDVLAIIEGLVESAKTGKDVSL